MSRTLLASLWVRPSENPTAAAGFPEDGARRGGARFGDLRNASVCAAVVLAAYLLSWPFTDLSFDDDWTFAFTVKRLAETGHLIYNGWSSPSVIAQAYWGLLWVKLFGFSFNVLRLSTLPLALGSVVLCYLLARRAGLAAALAGFAALLLGCSPLFLPLAASFMSDVPGLFFILLSLYALVRAAESPSRPGVLGWMTIGVIAALVGGTSRQIVWIVPLAVLPYVAWLRRADRAIVTAAVIEWVLLLSSALAIQAWFNRQPYALPESSIVGDVITGLKEPGHFAMGFITIALTVVLLALPATMSIWRVRGSGGGRRAAIAGTLLVGIAIVLLSRRHYAFAPWMRNILTPTGVLGATELPGDRPVVLIVPLRAALSLAVYVAVALMLASVVLWLVKPRRAMSQARTFFEYPANGRATLPVIALFSAAYLALLLTRAGLDLSYDRHVLPLIACFSVPLLMLYQNRGHRRPPALAWVMLAMYGLYAVATTQEVMALARARATAATRLLNAGVPATRFTAAFEYDGWTQLVTSGYINDPRICNPPGAYQRGKERLPSVEPLYTLQSRLTDDTAATPFGSVTYFSYLPPFRRTVMINRYVDPWWLDPSRAATRPVSRRHIVIAPSMRLPD